MEVLPSQQPVLGGSGRTAASVTPVMYPAASPSTIATSVPQAFGTPSAAMVMASTTSQFRTASGQRLVPGQTIRMAAGQLTIPGVPSTPLGSTETLKSEMLAQPSSGDGATNHQRVRTLPAGFGHKIGVASQGPPKLENCKSLVLVLHSASGLEADPAAILAARIFAVVSLGKSQVRTSMIHDSRGPGELDLNFVFRMPFEAGHPLDVKLIDSLTSAVVAEGSTTSFSTDLARTSVSTMQLFPTGEIRYNVRLSEAPNGSASVQKLNAHTTAPLHGLSAHQAAGNFSAQLQLQSRQSPTAHQVYKMDSYQSGAAFTIPQQTATSQFKPVIQSQGGIPAFDPLLQGSAGAVPGMASQPGRPQFNTVGEIATTQYYGPTSTAHTDGGISPATYINADGHTHVASASHIRSGTGYLSPQSNIRTFTSLDSTSTATPTRMNSHSRSTTADIPGEFIVGSLSGSRVIRSGALSATHARTRSEAAGATAWQVGSASPSGSREGVSVIRSSPFSSQLLQQQRGDLASSSGSMKSGTGHVRAFSVGSATGGFLASRTSPSASLRGIGFESPGSQTKLLSNATTLLGRLDSTVISLRQMPRCAMVPASVEEPLEDVTEILNDLRAEQSNSSLPKVKIIHPFRAVSVCVGGQLVSNRRRIIIGALSLGRMSCPAVEIVPVASAPTHNKGNIVVILPVDLQQHDHVIRVVSQAQHERKEYVDIPLHALLKRSLTMFRGKARMATCAQRLPSVPSMMCFSLKLLKLPIFSPVAYEIPMGSASLLVGHMNIADPLSVDSAEAPRSAAVSIPRSGHVACTPKLSAVTDQVPGTAASLPKADENPQWTALTVAVCSIDDSVSQIPLAVNEESTKDVYCKVSLGTTTALRAKFVNWRSSDRKFPDFDFPYSGERVLKVCFAGTGTSSKLNVCVCRIDLHTLLNTGHASFKGFVQMIPGEGFDKAPQVTLSFKFSKRDPVTLRGNAGNSGHQGRTSRPPKESSLIRVQPATTWNEVLIPDAAVSVTVRRIYGDDLTKLKSPFCLRASCGKFRVKSSRQELAPSADGSSDEPSRTAIPATPKEFNRPVKIDWTVTQELLDNLAAKPLVLCIYVKHPTTGIHTAYQFCRLQPGDFQKGPLAVQTTEASTELALAPGVDSNEPLCKIDYTMHVALPAASGAENKTAGSEPAAENPGKPGSPALSASTEINDTTAAVTAQCS